MTTKTEAEAVSNADLGRLINSTLDALQHTEEGSRANRRFERELDALEAEALQRGMMEG